MERQPLMDQDQQARLRHSAEMRGEEALAQFDNVPNLSTWELICIARDPEDVNHFIVEAVDWELKARLSILDAIIERHRSTNDTSEI